MPLLRKNGKELLFIHIPKCGGTSLEQAFSEELQVTLFHSGPGELPCSPQHFHSGLLEKLFDYRMPPTVAVVRNPFERIVSEYRYQVQHGLDSSIGFDRFVHNSLGEFWKNKYVHDNHIRPQVEFICTDTVIFRVEEDGIKAARNYISDYFQCSSEGKLSVKNASEKIDFSISPETILLINKFYARDFDLLGYSEIEAGKSERNRTALKYSAKPKSPFTSSSVIRQKVANDMVVVSEDYKAQMAAKFDQMESDRLLATELTSNLLAKMDDQAVVTFDLKALLESVRVEADRSGTQLGDLGRELIAALQDERKWVEEEVRRSQESLTASSNENTSRVEEKLLALEQALTTFKETQAQSLLEVERETIDQFKSLVDIQQREIGDLDERISSCSKQLMEAQANELYLNKRLEDALESEAKNREQISLLTELTLKLEKDKTSLEEANALHAQETQKNLQIHADDALVWQQDRERLEQENTVLAQECEALQQKIEEANNELCDTKSAWQTDKAVLEQEVIALAQESEALQRSVDEVNTEFSDMKSVWEADRTTLEQENAALKQESEVLKKKIEDANTEFSDMKSTWQRDEETFEQENATLKEESKALNHRIHELEAEFRANATAWDAERKVLQLESSSLASNISETRNTLLTSTTAWRHEKDSLLRASDLLTSTVDRLEQEKQLILEESNARALTIANMEETERELRRELQATLERFHSEIGYRESIKIRIQGLETDLKRVREHNKVLLESTSFRVTKPLRLLSRALRTRLPQKQNAGAILRLEDLSRESRKPPASIQLSDAILSRISQLDIAIVVENLDRGGLEQVVLDHARYFSNHCRSLDLYVIQETGQVYEQALQLGINVFCVNNEKEKLEPYLSGKQYDFSFFHHSYGFLPAFRPVTDTLVEVIHNEYSWQKGVGFFGEIRSQTIDRFIAVSEPVRKYAISNLAIKPDDITTIINGLNIEGLIRPPIEVLHAQRTLSLNESPTFVMCANGQPQKNHALVIKAFSQLLKKYPRAKLQLAGNLAVNPDVEREILAELKRCGNPANIELLGSLNRRALSKLLSNAHIALLPTKYEGFSIATLEYLYFGLPMILSDTGGASYIADNFGSVIIDKAITGSEGPPTNKEVKSLATNMTRLLREYSTFVQKSEHGARSFSSYTVDAVCLSYLDTSA